MRSRNIAAFAAAFALLATAAAPATFAGSSVADDGTTQAQRQEANRDDADAYEMYFPSHDGVNRLHADVLRPKGWDLTDTQPTPVILTVSPYTNHNGSTTDMDLFGDGPNPRFYDFLNLTNALGEGYTYVMVDLPGDGGSGGCNDWGGEDEQGAVFAAVEWAASQPWSDGNVALLGKSYDGWTGLMGIAQQPKGLKAVLSLEPVYSGYKYMLMNGVRRPNYGLTLGLFQVVDAKPGRPSDSPEYHANSAPQGHCYATNMAGGVGTSENSDYWTERDLLLTTIGKTTPLFLTQGFLETNTRSDGAFQYFNGLAGTQNRAWYGQFDHIRGWEKVGERWHTGRADFIEESMDFLDFHLKGIAPSTTDLPIQVQDIDGRWRGETEWPPADSNLYETELNTGTYTDTGSGRGDAPSTSQGIWSVSEPLAHNVWFSGEPVITASVTGPQEANFSANVYDISPNGMVRMISRGTHALPASNLPTARKNISFSMYGQDWEIAAGHRLGVLVASANSDEYLHVGTRQTVTVHNAKIGLPFLTFNRTEFRAVNEAAREEQGTPRLDGEFSNAPGFSQSFLDSMTRSFTIPGPLQER